MFIIFFFITNSAAGTTTSAHTLSFLQKTIPQILILGRNAAIGEMILNRVHSLPTEQTKYHSNNIKLILLWQTVESK